MKSHKLLAGIILLLFITSATTTIAYTPEGEGFVEVLLFSEKLHDIYLYSEVDFSLVVKNLTNGTISNITITQVLESNANLVSIMDQDISDNLSLVDTELVDQRSGNTLLFTYLNATSTNFTANIDISLVSHDYFVIGFTLNLTATGSFEFEQPQFTYYDHWGDDYSEVNGRGTAIRVREQLVDDRRIYFPTFGVDEPNYLQLILLLLGVVIIALFGRMLYGKKPIEL